jgi:hypothetical protein
MSAMVATLQKLASSTKVEFTLLGAFAIFVISSHVMFLAHLVTAYGLTH